MKCQWLITVLELLSAKACYKKRKYETAEPWRNREILTKKNSVALQFAITNLFSYSDWCYTALYKIHTISLISLKRTNSIQGKINRKNELLIAFNKLINFKSVIACFTSVFYDCFHMIIAHTLSNLLFDIYLLNDAFSIFEFPWL